MLYRICSNNNSQLFPILEISSNIFLQHFKGVLQKYFEKKFS